MVLNTNGWKRGAPFQEDAPLDENKVYAKLAEREDARRAKDFDLADDIMDELTHLGETLSNERHPSVCVLAYCVFFPPGILPWIPEGKRKILPVEFVWGSRCVCGCCI